MERIADIFRFRAEAVRLNWAAIAGKFAQSPLANRRRDIPVIDPAILRARAGDIRLTWGCAKELGVPYGPFTVWTRDGAGDQPKGVDVVTWSDPSGLVVWWQGEQAARVRVTCDVGSATQPVGLFLFRTTPSLHDAIAATAVTPSSATVTLDLATSGATIGLLVNGYNPRVEITRLDDVVNDGAWKPLELVGLPVDSVWAGTGYDTSPQGPLDNPVSPVDAALQRLDRGGPPFGWHPLTQAGRLAPVWSPPDYKELVGELVRDVLPQIGQLYDGSVPEFEQWLISNKQLVASPREGGSRLTTTADAKPWAALNLPAHSDPFLNLVTGFGTAYSQERMLPGQIGVGGADFLVTAVYRQTQSPLGGPVEVAAYAPQGIAHTQTPAPLALTATRSGVVPPDQPDLPWRETVRLNWNLGPSTAGLGTPTETAFARYDTGATRAEALIEPRVPTGWRPLVLSADAPAGQAGHDRASVVDSAAVIPLGSGGRQVGYAVAVSDVYGVWSRWSDAPYAGDEPLAQGARVISLALGTRFTGSATCPSTLDLEVATEWLERRTSSIDIVAMYFPMSSPTTPPPAGLSPAGPAPAGGFRRDLGITFAGDVPTGSGCTVSALDAEGTSVVAPGPAQGDGGRRYRVHADVPALDFGATGRWGVQVWARRTLFVGASPTGWTPDAAHPAIASAASPVPIAPLPIPPLPGVPLASLPDAEGHAHARIVWSLPAGAAPRRTVVWEIAETALRQTVGLSPSAPESDVPGARLVALRAAYDALPAAQRRTAFRRIAEVDGTLRAYDAVLPRGSTDIHLFAVTTTTVAGVDSPWPGGSAEASLRAFIAPRLARPAPPLVRSHPGAAGTTVIELSSASRVPVARFRLLRTRSESAARRAETMGPAFVEVAVVAPPTATDSVTGDPIYVTTWTGAFPPHWDEWFVRAIALPVDTVPALGVRGLPSDPSDAVSISVIPDAAPDLAPLAITVDAAHTGIVVRSSTSAPAHAVVAGNHRLGATAGDGVAPLELLKALWARFSTDMPPLRGLFRII